MRFQPWRCPVCAQHAKGVLETIPGLALLVFEDNGEAQYAGGTDVCWDGQETVCDQNGQATLVCPEGHQWPAVVDGVTATPVASSKTKTSSYDLRIDGPLLRAQRERLLELANGLQRGIPIQAAPDDRRLIDGLINLTDEIADQAADRYGIDCLVSESGKEETS